MKIFYYKQLNAMDCGPTCLRIISKYYGKHYSAETLRGLAGFNRSGVSLLGLSDTAEKLGMRSRGVKLTYSQLSQDALLPCILHWDNNHFVVIVSIRNNKITIANPAIGNKIVYSKEDFLKHWVSDKSINNETVGIALLISPNPEFYEARDEKEKKLSWSKILVYLFPHRKNFLRVLTTLALASLLQLIFPFLTQGMVDKGINAKDISFITLILIAQLILTITKTSVDFIRSRMLIKISNSINMAVLSDFWIKLTKIPLSYYETHSIGDTLQRIGDNGQIQGFITGTALNTLFSLSNFIIYTILLLWYNPQLFLVFAIGNTIYFLWVQLFQRLRRKFNNEAFSISTLVNNTTLQMVQGMSDLRLNCAEKKMRWKWENIQATQFRLGYKRLNYSQLQQAGALLINQLKNIVTSYLVARMVVTGHLTFGEMFAVQYIIAQMNSPISQMVGFVQSLQDAKISMERLNEIHKIGNDEPKEKHFELELPTDKSINITNLSFTYPGAGNDLVLKNINLVIPTGKITAIVGSSGSGKTTLLRLLLKYYDSYNGEIKIGSTELKNISPSFWRNCCGAVMQDGFIFNETICNNIGLGAEIIDFKKLIDSSITANIKSFIDSLPNGFNTKLGMDATGISQGQKQRILIARSVYKDPEYLFFDEATNALDANNEKMIVENLNTFFKGRTVVIVAHRLSTVKNADKIVVLENGIIMEEGNHSYLTKLRGRYFELVKNQLELGNN